MKGCNILQPFKPLTIRGLSTSCQLCDVRFQILLKQEHQCKRCLRAICQKCGPNRLNIYVSHSKKFPHRHCLICAKEHMLLEDYKQEHKLSFGQDSQFAEEWLHKLNKDRLTYEQIMTQYADVATLTNQNIREFKSQADQLFDELWDSYNYSFKHFIGLMSENVAMESFKDKVSNVMKAIYAHLGDVPYVPQLIYLVIFILCFSSEAHCYFIVSRLLEKAYPQYMRMHTLKKDNILTNEIKVLIDMYKLLCGKVERPELETVTGYLNMRFPAYVESFTLNVCSIENSFMIVRGMFESGSHVQFYKGIAALLANARDLILNDKTPEEIDSHVLRNVTLEQAKTTFLKFEKLNAKFEVETELFDSAEHQKLYEKFKQMQSLYQKSEENLRLSEAKLKNTLREMEKMRNINIQRSAQIMGLQEDILKYSDQLPMLDQIERITEESSILSKKNKLLLEEVAKLQKQIEDIEKDSFVKQSNFRIFSKLEKSYTQEITKLKTANQIYEIEKKAREIDFNTSFIDHKISSKNTLIMELEEKNNYLQSQLEFYKKKHSDEEYFNSSLSGIQHKNSTLSFSQTGFAPVKPKDNVKKLIDMSKEVIDKLKVDLSEAQQKIIEKDKIIAELTELTTNQQARLELNVEVEKFIKEIPEEKNYDAIIAQFQRITSKETNVAKKEIFRDILAALNQCLHEIKYRAIDARLKESKIKSICDQNIADILRKVLSTHLKVGQNESAVKPVENIEEKMLPGNLSEQLEQSSNLMKIKLSKEDCCIY